MKLQWGSEIWTSLDFTYVAKNTLVCKWSRFWMESNIWTNGLPFCLQPFKIWVPFKSWSTVGKLIGQKEVGLQMVYTSCYVVLCYSHLYWKTENSKNFSRGGIRTQDLLVSRRLLYLCAISPHKGSDIWKPDHSKFRQMEAILSTTF